MGIVGDNGSGKSTLLQILAGAITPDAGSVTLAVKGNTVSRGLLPYQCGFVAPYLELYDEFTPLELLTLHARLRGQALNVESARALCETVGLGKRATDVVRTFSSGMRQRVAIALAVSLDPPLLIFDEPSTTLDADGRRLLSNVIREQAERGGIVILATNDEREQTSCTTIFDISPYSHRAS